MPQENGKPDIALISDIPVSPGIRLYRQRDGLTLVNTPGLIVLMLDAGYLLLDAGCWIPSTLVYAVPFSIFPFHCINN